jgi:hypothetical protein
MSTLLSFLPPPEAQCKPYYSDYSRFRLLVHHLCTSHYLDLFITGVIGLNVVTMAMEHYQQPQVRSRDEASSLETFPGRSKDSLWVSDKCWGLYVGPHTCGSLLRGGCHLCFIQEDTKSR